MAILHPEPSGYLPSMDQRTCRFRFHCRSTQKRIVPAPTTHLALGVRIRNAYAMGNPSFKEEVMRMANPPQIPSPINQKEYHFSEAIILKRWSSYYPRTKIRTWSDPLAMRRVT